MNAGYEVFVANNGIDGYQGALTQHPDIILLDMNMPLLDGPGMLMKMHDHADLREIPVIMLTANSDVQAVKKVLSMGVKGYIVKPFIIDVFEDQIKKIFLDAGHELSPKEKIQASIEKKVVRYEERNWGHVFSIVPDSLKIGIKLVFSYIRRLIAVNEQRFVLDFSAYPVFPSEDITVLGSSVASLQNGKETVSLIASTEALRTQFYQFKETAGLRIFPSLYFAENVFLGRHTGREGYLGVIPGPLRMKQKEWVNALGLTGALVDVIQANSPAERVGIEIEDVITHIAGNAIRTHFDLYGIIAGTAPGTTIEIKLLRASKTITVQVTVEERFEKA